LEQPESDPHLWLPQIIGNALAGNFSFGVLIVLLIILALIFISAMISGSEIAFFSITPSQLKDFREKESTANKIILSLLKAPERLLATILITNNFVNVGIVILSAYISSSLFNFTSFPILGFIIEVIAITLVILLFGEIMPKIFANQKPLVFSTIMARPLNFLMKFFYPISSLLVRTTNIIDKRLATQNREITMSEISDAIEITADDNAPEEDRKISLKNLKVWP